MGVKWKCRTCVSYPQIVGREGKRDEEDSIGVWDSTWNSIIKNCMIILYIF